MAYHDATLPKPIRAEAAAWSVRMEGYGGPAQPAPTIAQCLDGGLGWLEVECNRCRSRASLPLDRHPPPARHAAVELEASLKCRSCRKGRTAPPVHMIKLTAKREITPISGCIRMRRGEAGLTIGGYRLTALPYRSKSERLQTPMRIIDHEFDRLSAREITCVA